MNPRLETAPPGPATRLDLFWSKELLKGFPLAAFDNPNYGYGFFDDFTDGLPTGKYTATQATTGTFALGDALGGVALVDCDSSTVVQGINVQLGGTAGEMFKPAANKIIIFTARLKFVDTASGPEFFVGLHETDTTIIGTSALTGSNYVGYSSVTDNKVLLSCAAKAGAASTDTGTTMVEDTYKLLEFRINGVTSIEFFVDGSKVTAASFATAYVPIVEMRPSIVCQSDGAVDTIVHLDGWGCWVSDPTRA